MEKQQHFSGSNTLVYIEALEIRSRICEAGMYHYGSQHHSAQPNEIHHLSLRTWWEPFQDEMEAYFGKPTKALKCKPPAACLDSALFVLVEELLFLSIRDPGTREGPCVLC